MPLTINALRSFVHASKEPMEVVRRKTHEALHRMYKKSPKVDGGDLKTLIACAPFDHKKHMLMPHMRSKHATMRGYDSEGRYIGGYHIPFKAGRPASFVPAAREKGVKWARKTLAERIAEFTATRKALGDDEPFVLTLKDSTTMWNCRRGIHDPEAEGGENTGEDATGENENTDDNDMH